MSLKKAQTLIEYLILLGVAAAVATPLVAPIFNQGSKQIIASGPQKNDSITASSNHQTTPLPTYTPSATPVSPFEVKPIVVKDIQLGPTWGSTPVGSSGGSSSGNTTTGNATASLPKVYAFATVMGCGGIREINGGKYEITTSATMKEMYTDEVSATAVNVNNKMDTHYAKQVNFDYHKFGGIFDRLSGEALTLSQNYCDNSQISLYQKKVILFNDDGTLNGRYDMDQLESLNSGIEFVPVLKKPGYNTLNGKILTLPDGSQVQIEENAWFSPLIFDLDGNGIQTVKKTIKYDINGDGKPEEIHNIHPKDGILILRKGKSGLDLFGDNTDLNNDGKKDGFINGFQALEALARKDHLVSDTDRKLDSKDIKVLEKKYKLGMKIRGYYGKIRTLESLGITEITIGVARKNTSIRNFDKRGDILMLQQGAGFKIQQKSNIFADVWHKVVDAFKNIVKNFQHLK